jgi:hypothetical protein
MREPTVGPAGIVYNRLMAEGIEQHDKRIRRCPMLGHDIAFVYCRAPASELPCSKVFDCWFEMFDVRGFIREHFTPEQIERILAPRQDKAATLVELIQRARQRRQSSDGAD